MDLEYEAAASASAIHEESVVTLHNSINNHHLRPSSRLQRTLTSAMTSSNQKPGGMTIPVDPPQLANEMTAMQYAKQKLVNRLFDKVSVGNFSNVLRLRGSS